MIDDDSIVSLTTAATADLLFIRWAGGASKTPFEDNQRHRRLFDALDGRTQCAGPWSARRSRHFDLVFDALEHAGVDASSARSSGPTRKRLSIEQSAERIHAGIRTACDVIETLPCWGGWKSYTGSLLRSANSRNPTGSSNPA